MPDFNESLQQASQWTRNYRDQNPDSIKAHCLSRTTLQAILAQPGCVGVRAYYALDDAGERKLILVGYDANDNDLLTGPSVAARGTKTSISSVESTMESSVQSSAVIDTNPPPCPPCCSVSNALNS